ncbi:MAG: flagellar basal-body rod protein FlgF [SAR324 cluster bacterium]|uniref:Flagellar basal-body rod protein FlgF n=1 Tax=SAR324 cluster bacterium TaxID=2024889 RepID=A0A2A4T9G3_9DELT|nr:MAG: flagellar basal-body rod protein FlgF [SAR324 cluster bacterium]
METIYTLLSALKGQQRQMDSVSNNLANVNTPGFKEDEVLFREYYTKFTGQDLESEEEKFVHHEFLSPQTRGATSFVRTDQVVQKMAMGNFKTTGNDLDLALQSEGFFVVQTPYGARYTRNGQFLRDSQGYLSTSAGHRVLGKNGPILMAGKNIAVGRDGVVLVDDKIIDTIQVVNFEQPGQLNRMGNSYLAPATAEQKPFLIDNFILEQGTIEGSNVNTVKEMVKMIAVNRSYEAAQKALRTTEELDQSSISIARI